MDDLLSLADAESLFMALADRTRLRLMNLMRDTEVCVCFFTEVLDESQPKISRHLAYLRNAGLAAARRDGKWMHYSLKRPSDKEFGRILDSLFEWMDGRADLLADREKYQRICCSPEMLVQIARTPIEFISQEADVKEEHAEQSTSYHNELDEFLL